MITLEKINDQINNNADQNPVDYFNNLLTEGGQQPVDQDVNSYEIKLPPWYDRKLYKRAQKFYNDHLFSMLVSNFTGLVATLAVSSILKVLVCTQQSETSLKAYRRYMRTVYHTWNFYSSYPEGNSKCMKSLAAVRKNHILSSKYSHKHNAGMVTQKDMAITQFGFMGFLLVRPKMLGVKEDTKDFEALVHFWRVIGYMLGIEDRFNICTDSFATTLPRLQYLMNNILVPALLNPVANFQQMIHVMVDGLWCFTPFISTPSILFMTKRLAGVPGYYYTEEERVAQIEAQTGKRENDNVPIINNKKGEQSKFFKMMDWWNRCLMIILVFVLETLIYNFTIARLYFNSQMKISEFLIIWFPFLAFYKFGIRNSYVRILKGND